MTRLKARIVDLIEASGPISVAEYMALCLSDPQDGYYSTREPFGRGGDFITAPEISQMFGELVGAWIVSVWRGMGSPPGITICEIGPGRGTLMKDMARAIGKLAPQLIAASRLMLVETSDRLALAQATALEGIGGTFEWTRTVGELPNAPLIIVGNELFDAIPIRQYAKTAEGWRERLVDIDDNGNMIFVAGAGVVDPALLPPDAPGAPEGAIAEIAPARIALMQEIAAHVSRHGGAALFVDYGHLEPGLGDTLQAMIRHAYDDPLAHPGEADLTSHVDFASLGAAAKREGLAVATTTQGEFLLRLGLLERAGHLGAMAEEETRERLRGEVERLAAPDQMGNLFKVMGVAAKEFELPGFGS